MKEKQITDNIFRHIFYRGAISILTSLLKKADINNGKVDVEVIVKVKKLIEEKKKKITG